MASPLSNKKFSDLILFFTKKRCKNVVPDLGFPTITTGFVIRLFLTLGKTILSINMPRVIMSRKIDIRRPEKTGEIQMPKEWPIVR